MKTITDPEAALTVLSTAIGKSVNDPDLPQVLIFGPATIRLDIRRSKRVVKDRFIWVGIGNSPEVQVGLPLAAASMALGAALAAAS